MIDLGSRAWREASGAEEMETAIKAFLWPQDILLTHRCECQSGPCDNAPQGSINGRRLSLCPRGLQRQPYFQAVVNLVAALDAGAVEGWPTRFGAGIVDGVHSFRALREKKRAQDYEQAMRRARR